MGHLWVSIMFIDVQMPPDTLSNTNALQSSEPCMALFGCGQLCTQTQEDLWRERQGHTSSCVCVVTVSCFSCVSVGILYSAVFMKLLEHNYEAVHKWFCGRQQAWFSLVAHSVSLLIHANYLGQLCSNINNTDQYAVYIKVTKSPLLPGHVTVQHKNVSMCNFSLTGTSKDNFSLEDMCAILHSLLICTLV